ncbi:MAG: 6-phosphogluconolactonase, partial [Candidatus Aminicenantes bacterium]|nr:6-phosphogluconolactonase [Candidatus Aminicenantes bacterium]
MPIRVVLTRDYAHMSEAAAGLVKASIIELSKTKKEVVLGLATGRSPAGMYKHLAGAANDGEFDSGRIRSFNLDEYVGLPGENPQQRIMRPQSYCYFMIQEFFGLLKK